MKGRINPVRFCFAERRRIRFERAVASEEVIVVYTVIAVAVLLVLGLLFYVGAFSRDLWRRPAISTIEWVKLMRENDLRFDRATRARAAKLGPSRMS